jgi:hypothetical protein
MRAWLAEHSQFAGREARPLRELLKSSAEQV